MTPQGTPRRNGGRRTATAVLAALAVVGAALLVFALTHQVGAPPEPATPAAHAGASALSAPASTPPWESERLSPAL